jgi:Ycf66 protein N-terminus
MLAYILAVVVGTGSVGLYLAAFFLPAVHRKQDFIWSGVGLFYALFLWLYAHQVTGGILVGQTSSVVLLGWLTWQIFNLRRQVAPFSPQIPISNSVDRSNPKAPKSTAKPTATVPDASTPLANVRVPAKAATTPDRATKTTTNPASITAKSTPPVTPVGTEALPRERRAAPANTSPAPQPSNLDPVKAAPVERKTAPAIVGGASPQENRSSQPANTQPTIPPAAPQPPTNLDSVRASRSGEQKTTPTHIGGVEVAAPLENRISPPAIPDTPASPQSLLDELEEDLAWITLEVKPAPTQPLGTPAQPPAAKIPPPPQPKVVPEVVPDRNIPTDTIQTTAKIDAEDGK